MCKKPSQNHENTQVLSSWQCHASSSPSEQAQVITRTIQLFKKNKVGRESWGRFSGIGVERLGK